MTDIDLKLKLFIGDEVFADEYGYIKPLTFREIVKFGYTNYMQCLNILCVEVKDFIKDVDDKELEGIDVFNILLSLGGEEIEAQLESALSLFLGGEAIVDKENLAVIVEKDGEFKAITNENFDNIREVIKWQNYVNHFDDKSSSFNPSNEKARKLKEKMEKLKQQRDAIKKKREGNDDEENDIDLYDIVEAMSSKAYSVNELNIMDLTIYQIYSKFKRLETIDQYNINIKSILAGATDVKLKHWSSKLG